MFSRLGSLFVHLLNSRRTSFAAKGSEGAVHNKGVYEMVSDGTQINNSALVTILFLWLASVYGN